MEKNNKHHNFLAYMNNPMSKESIDIIYSANKICYEKCELYSDFIQSLLMIVYSTYMGDELTDKTNQTKHFNWCWEKNISNFKNEGINFKNDKLYGYFKEYMFEVFYSIKDKNPSSFTDKISLKMWYNIFDYEKIKTNSDVDTLIEIYKIFDK
jgi:hypothetical protein